MCGYTEITIKVIIGHTEVHMKSKYTCKGNMRIKVWIFRSTDLDLQGVS